MTLYGLYPKRGSIGGLYGDHYMDGAHFSCSSMYSRRPHFTYTLGQGVNYYGKGEACLQGVPNNSQEVQGDNEAVKNAQNTIQNYQNIKQPNAKQSSNDKDSFVPQTREAKLLDMQYMLESAKNRQGIFGKAIDKVKSVTKLGLSAKTCQDYINAAKNNIMDVDLAHRLVSEYSVKQNNMLNTVTGVSAAILGAAIFKGKANSKALMAALGAGASLKAGVKAIDRFTSKDKTGASVKDVARDALQGAMNGAVGVGAYQLMNTGKSYSSMQSAILGGSLKGGAIGASGGAVIGAGDYALECAFDKNNKFNKDHFKHAVASSAIAGGAVGLVGGGIKEGKRYSKENKSIATEEILNEGAEESASEQPNVDNNTQQAQTEPVSQQEGNRAPVSETNPETNVSDDLNLSAESTEASRTETPKIEAQSTEAVKAEAPSVEVPKAETPNAEPPKAEQPKVEQPKAEKPKVEQPKTEQPKAEEAPKTEVPKNNEPKEADNKPAQKQQEKPADKPSEQKPADKKPDTQNEKSEEQNIDDKKDVQEKPIKTKSKKQANKKPDSKEDEPKESSLLRNVIEFLNPKK